MAKKVAKKTRKNKAKDTVTGSECQRVWVPMHTDTGGHLSTRTKPILVPTCGYDGLDTMYKSAQRLGKAFKVGQQEARSELELKRESVQQRGTAFKVGEQEEREWGQARVLKSRRREEEEGDGIPRRSLALQKLF
ncbi:hypothetical protein BC827DRAFT_1155164 [Russula dissimulans]|nr:hypothetical protein BC827DRAFT_1155164 [Russula dissimulans]